MHKGDPIRQALRKAGRRVRLERLPPYAPMLNPAAELNGRVVRELTAIRDDQALLRSFLEHNELTSPLIFL